MKSFYKILCLSVLAFFFGFQGAAAAATIDAGKYFAYVKASRDGTVIAISNQKCQASGVVTDRPDMVKKAIFYYPYRSQVGCWIERKQEDGSKIAFICPMMAKDSDNDRGELDQHVAVCVSVPYRQFLKTESLPEKAF